MDTKVNYAAVGAFVIFLATAIIFMAIWLTVGLQKNDYNNYLVFINESVTGLNIGAPVKYNGVDVGNVKDIFINPKNIKQVELILNITHGTPITKSTIATLSTLGITGNAFIDLQSKGSDFSPLMASADSTYPIIPSAPSLFIRLDTVISNVAQNLGELSKSLQMVLGTENRDAFTQTLKNFQLASQASSLATQSLVKQTIPQLNQILTNTQTITRNLNMTSQEIKQNPAILLRGQTTRPLGPGES